MAPAHIARPLALGFLLLAACARHPDPLPGFPRVVLWAWERPEDFRWLPPRAAAIAYLARTVCPTEDGVAVRPRLQPLGTQPGAILMAVVRIESGGRARQADAARTARAIAPAAVQPAVRALQIDFDALVSERDFYRRMLLDLRRLVPAPVPISITALASWCLSDRWTAGLPVAEAVPMLFRMGSDRYAPGSDFDDPLCRASVGVATDELPSRIPSGRRIYIFHPRPWTESDVQAALMRISRW